MKTLNLGIVLDQGADFSVVVRVNGINGPVNITGYQFLGQIRKTTSVVDSVVAEFDFTILDQVAKTGQFRWFLPLAESAESAMPTSLSNALQTERLTTPYVFDVKMKDTSGNVSRPIQGIIYLSPQAAKELFS